MSKFDYLFYDIDGPGGRMRAMQAIHKYSLDPTIGSGTHFYRSMPLNLRILCIQVVRETPVIYALVDPKDKDFVDHSFEVIPTGFPFEPKDQEYIGTFQLEGGRLVFHAFKNPHDFTTSCCNREDCGRLYTQTMFRTLTPCDGPVWVNDSPCWGKCRCGGRVRNVWRTE